MRRLRLLWVTPDLPRPGVSASAERWWALLARLATRHDITLLAIADPDVLPLAGTLPAGLADVHLVPRLPYTPDDPFALLPQAVAGAHADPRLRDAIAARLASAPFDLAQYEWIEMANLIPRSRTPAVLALHQIGFAAQGPRWRAEGRGLARGAVLLHRYLRNLDFELRAVARADHVITMSPEDAARLRRFLPLLPVSVSPVGVDCAVLRPIPSSGEYRSPLLFVGNFIHPPNADAVRFLADGVLPRLGPDVRLHVVGHGAPTIADPRIVTVGPVRDTRPWLAGAEIVLAPVRFGTGMHGKVVEAMAMGRPVVTTSPGTEGLGAVDGVHLLVGDDAPAFAAAVRRLLGDPGEAARLGAAARALVESRFDWDAIAHEHDAIYDRVLRDRSAGRRPVGAKAFAIPARPLVRGWPAVALGGLRLGTRALAWHARASRARRAAGPPAPVAVERPAAASR